MKKFSPRFPVMERYTYLNWAASGLLSEELFDFRRQHDLDFLTHGSIFREQQEEILTGVRKQVGKSFHCPRNGVMLCPNFSYGMERLVAQIPDSFEVLLLEGDYPALSWPFKSRDFSITFVPIDENLEQHVLRLLRKKKIDVFAFSLVQYLDGIRIRTDFLEELQQQFPDLLLLADGTQYLGTEIFDFENFPVDIIGASGYKWLNAGYGNAFFMFRENLPEKLHHSLRLGEFQARHKPQEESVLGYLEPGHRDTWNFSSLQKALEILSRQELDLLQGELRDLSAMAKKNLGEKGLLSPEVQKRSVHSSIFNLRTDKKLLQRLRENQILCAERGNGIRISFHLYNDFSDLEKLMSLL